ncbi:hypothetical protein HYS48_04865 [Candidatus Woesearchaeota archaeon]|nr:hypothetical protein [Candidatus Woesearchaeota archaeon]
MPVAEQSTFRGIIEFFARLGIYDVILPFLLVFSIIFAILEKTKLFGTEKAGGNEYTRKNINAMVAFVVAFLVVASSRLVAAINEALARVVLLMLVGISFILLIGVFYHHEEKVFLEGPWRKFFMVLMFIGVVLIFLQAIKTDQGIGWLEYAWSYIAYNFYASVFVDSLILLIVVIAFMWFITKEPKGAKKEEHGHGGSH